MSVHKHDSTAETILHVEFRRKAHNAMAMTLTVHAQWIVWRCDCIGDIRCCCTIKVTIANHHTLGSFVSTDRFCLYFIIMSNLYLRWNLIVCEIFQISNILFDKNREKINLKIFHDLVNPVHWTFHSSIYAMHQNRSLEICCQSIHK